MPSRTQRIDKPVIFLSHFTYEASVANALKRFIEDSVAHAVDVFVSGNQLSLRPGDPWEKTIRRSLRESKLVLSLLSSDSLQRPWIHFEAGAAWFRRATLIPLLHRGLTRDALPQLFQTLQSICLNKHDEIEALMKTIQEIYGLRAGTRQADYIAFARELSSLAQQIDSNLNQEEESLSTVAFTLYSKTHAQERANSEAARPHLVHSFRKPNLNQVFSALCRTGQACTNIVSLDEYWADSLAEGSWLQPLSCEISKHILKELQQFSHYEGECWTLPHFLDFSYYATREVGGRELVEGLRTLVQSDETTYRDALHTLKNIADTPKLLAYDFRSADTAACVICEFIDSLGAGLTSLGSPAEFSSAANVRALEILRDLVGQRPREDFVWGKPLNLDTECHEVAILRHWHSMVSDEAEARRTHIPVFQFPIKGTLGGWYLGMLANPPFELEGYQALQGFFQKDYQLRRFQNGAGLPTLALFYHDPNYSCFLDPILNWKLEDIVEYVRCRLIRRSALRHFHLIREVLAGLHNEIMTQYETPISAVLSRYTHKLPAD